MPSTINLKNKNPQTKIRQKILRQSRHPLSAKKNEPDTTTRQDGTSDQMVDSKNIFGKKTEKDVSQTDQNSVKFKNQLLKDKAPTYDFQSESSGNEKFLNDFYYKNKPQSSDTKNFNFAEQPQEKDTVDQPIDQKRFANLFSLLNQTITKQLAAFILIAVLILSPLLLFLKPYSHKPKIDPNFDDLLVEMEQGFFNLQQFKFQESEQHFTTVFNFIDDTNLDENTDVPLYADTQQINNYDTSTSTNDLYKSVHTLALAGRELSILLQQLNQVQNIDKSDQILEDNLDLLYEGSAELQNNETRPEPNFVTEKFKIFVEAISIFEKQGSEVVEILNMLKDTYFGIDDKIFQEITDYLETLLQTIQNLKTKDQLFLHLLGHETTNRFLVLYQNNAAQQPKGGYIQYYSTLKVTDGTFQLAKEMSIEEHFVESKTDLPDPLQQQTDSWNINNIDWYPEFSKSAESVSSILTPEFNESLDGIILINKDCLINLANSLQSMNENPEIIEQIQSSQADSEMPFTNNEEMGNAVITVLNSHLSQNNTSQSLIQMISILNEEALQKNFLVHLNNFEYNSDISDLGWSGQLVEAEKDYLNISYYPLETSATQSEVTLNVKIENNGEIINTLSFVNKASQSSKTARRGANYIRIYVPLNSQTLSQEGFSSAFNNTESENKTIGTSNRMNQNNTVDNIQTYSESHKTVFAGYIDSSQDTASITYKLPFQIDPIDNYHFYLQSQPRDAVDFNIEFKVDKYQIVKDYEIEGNDLANDYFRGLILKK